MVVSSMLHELELLLEEKPDQDKDGRDLRVDEEQEEFAEGVVRCCGSYVPLEREVFVICIKADI